MVKVSVIVPVYDVEKYLDKCLFSLISQTLEDIEIIVVNDGSPDHSQEIIDSYIKLYPDKVRSLIKLNGGLSDARNFGIPYCNGEYIGFIDSDDYVEPDMFEKLYFCAKRENSDIVMCDYYEEYESYKRLIKVTPVKKSDDLFYSMLAAAWNKIYKKDLITNSDILFPKGLIYEDTAFFTMLIPHVKKVSCVNEPLVHYVQRIGSIANTQGTKTAQIFDVFNVIISYYQEKGYYVYYKNKIEYLCIKIIFGSSLKRIARINKAALRRELAKESVRYVNNMFPKWKDNEFLNNNLSLRHKFLLIISPPTIVPIVEVIHILLLAKEKNIFS
jgi:glycosyltransferase involved in cell wall biosynthesis